MAYVIDPHEAVADELRRIADEQISRALADLAVTGEGQHEAIHEARKRFKKLRGLLRLMRPANADFYRAENQRIGDAGRALSGLRDITAAIETLERVEQAHADTLAPDAFAGIRMALLEQRSAASQSFADLEDKLIQARAALTTARQNFATLELPKKPAPAKLVAKGALRAREQVEEALSHARKTRSAEDLHELRKANKYHWMHVRLLRHVLDKAEEERAALKQADIALGELHDIDTLLIRLADGANAAFPQAEVAALTTLLHADREAHADVALKLAHTALACGGAWSGKQIAARLA